jgi:hypothetical protein
MRKLFPVIALSVSVVAMCLIQSCVKSISDGFMEPITIIHPDTLSTTYVQSGDKVPIQIQFETDRPILWAKCSYEIDSPGAAALATYRTYPNMQFYATPAPPYNKYGYTGSFTVPAGLNYLDTVRFDVQMKAANNPSSPDSVFYDKQFKVVLR